MKKNDHVLGSGKKYFESADRSARQLPGYAAGHKVVGLFRFLSRVFHGIKGHNLQDCRVVLWSISWDDIHSHGTLPVHLAYILPKRMLLWSPSYSSGMRSRTSQDAVEI